MSANEDRFVGFEKIDDVTFPMPYKFDAEKLRKVFSNDFDIVEVTDSYFFSTVTDPPARAIFAILKNAN